MSLILGFAVTVAILPREVVSCRDFILRSVVTFWVMSLVGIYPGRASIFDTKYMVLFMSTISASVSNFDLGTTFHLMALMKAKFNYNCYKYNPLSYRSFRKFR